MRARSLALLVLGLCVPAIAGCITVGESFRRHGLNRAAFEMQCPPEYLQIVGLNRPLDATSVAGSQVGVTGCGKRMVFVVTKAAGWVANSGYR
jgi:hypothetical protein